MSDFNEITKQIAESLAQHGPEIKIGFGLASGGAALALGIYGSSRVTKIFMEKAPSTTKEKLMVIAKGIGPAFIAELASLYLVIKGVKGIEDAKNEALETAAAATTTAILAKEALKIKNEAVKETCDEKQQKEITYREAQKHLDKSPIEGRQVTMTKDPQQLFHDKISDRYFMSSVQEVEDAFKSLRKKMCYDEGHRHNGVGFVGVNEMFWELQLPTLKAFDQLGWREDIDGPLYPDLSPGFATDGRTCVEIDLEIPDTSYWELARYKINSRSFP